MKKIILTLSILFPCLVGMLFLGDGGNPKVHAQDLYSDVVFGALQAEVDKLPDDAGALIILPGRTFEKNSNQQFPSYSVIKLWIAATTYDLSSRGQFPINPRTALLIESMLENSDNSATNTLIDELGGFDVVNNFISSRYGSTTLGRKMLETPSAGSDNLSSPGDAVAFMQDLVNGNLAGADDITAILRNRTSTGGDPFKPNAGLPATADFIGKSGILGEGRNDVGSFLGENGNRVFFAIFLPSGGADSETLISNIEQLMYNPTAPLTAAPGAGVAVTGRGTMKGSRVCVKVGVPTDPMPEICNTPTFGGSLSSGATPGEAPPVEPSQLSQVINDEFGLEMRGSWDQQHLQWIYEKFYGLKQQTKFIELVSGQPIVLTTEIPNQESGYVKMSQIGDYASDRDYFIGTLIHELGHTIYHNNTLAESLKGEVNNLFSRIGCISSYSRCQTNNTENYPEVISYCLNNKAVGNINQEKWPEYRNIAVGIMGICYN